MELLINYKIKRLLHRILWKCFPINESKCLAMLIKQKDTHLYPTVQTIDQTIVKLLSGNYSIARYGDGEYTLCFERPIGFQKADKRLRNRLREILKSDSSFCIIAIPEFKPEEISPFWIRYWYENFYFIVKLFRKDAVYYNQSISRDFTLDQIHKLKQLWKNRFVVFICGKGSRFDVTHELFADIDGYTIVFGLALNAFVEYNSLLERTYIVLSKFENPLVLIA